MEEGTSNNVIEKYYEILKKIENFLPFLKKIIESSCQLKIENENLKKLHILYEMAESRKLKIDLDLPFDLWLPPDQLGSCEKVIDGLYKKYHKLIEQDEILVTTDSKKLIQSTEDENKTKSSEINLSSNKNDQEPSSKPERSSKMIMSNLIENKSPNNNIDELKYATEPKNDPVINSSNSIENDGLNNDSLFTKIDLPKFTDSRLRLNKVIGFAANASIEKLNIYDTTISHSELAKQIYDDINKHKNNTLLCQNMLKGINMNDIDVNDVREVIESLKKTNAESIEPVKLLPSDSMSLKATNEIPSSELNEGHVTSNSIMSVPQPSLSSIPNKSISVREKLNGDIDVVYKIGSSNEPKQKISMLKPGALIDLNNSKATCTSSNIKSFKPVIGSNEKSSDIKPRVDIGVPRDPRIRNKSLSIPSLLQMNVQKPSSVPIKHKSISGSKNNSFLPIGYLNNTDSQYEISHSKFSGYNDPINFQSLSVNNNIQSSNKQLSIEQGRNLNISQLNASVLPTQQQYKHNYNNANDSQKKETIVRNYEPGSSNTYYRNNLTSRDPRSMKNLNQRTREPNYYSYKEYREAKQQAIEKQKECNKFVNNKKDQEYLKSKYSSKNITDTNSLYNSFGVSNDSTGIKNFKIPKIKRKENTYDNKQIESPNIKTGTMKSNIIKDNNLTKDFNTNIIENKINEDTKTETVIVNKNLTSDNNEKIKHLFNDENLSDPNVDDGKINNIEIKSNYVFGEHKKKPKKPKKYTNEKEFEKIVKEAVVQTLNSDFVNGPRTRTRSSLKKKEKYISIIDLNNEEKNITKNNKDYFSGECSKNIDNTSCPSTKNLSELNDIGQNIISSTSEELVDVDSSIEVVSKNNKNEIVSSNEINSTEEDVKSNSNRDDNFLSMLENPEILSVINYLHENPNHLNELVKNTNVNKSKSKNILNKQHLNIEKQTKSKKKMKKERKKRRKLQKIIDSKDKLSENVEISNTNTSFKSDDINLNEKYMSLKAVSVKDQDNSSNDPKLNFEILKDRAKLKDLKIVITKYDKIRNNTTLNISNNVQAPIQSIKNDIVKQLEPKKKPFLGPLSVKLAKQKMEFEQNCLGSKINESAEMKIITKKQIISKKVKKSSTNNLRNNTKEQTMVNVINQVNSNTIEQPYVVLESIESISSKFDEFTNSDKNLQEGNDLKEQNSNKITTIESNINDTKSEIKKSKPKMTELDKLHADINENCAAILNISNIRHCRTNKQNCYVNSNIVPRKKNSISTIIKPDIFKVKKNKVKKSTGKLNKNKHLIKKNITKDIGTFIMGNNLIANKKNNVSRPSKFKKLKSKRYKANMKNKQLMDLTKLNSCEISQSNNNFDNQANTEETTKILIDNDYKDKLYFQTANNSLECKFCYYNDTGLNIVRHYIDQHNEEEVLPSRLSKECAEILINESLKENLGYRNFEDTKLSQHGSVNFYFTCVFCQVIFYDLTNFYDHVTSHTGEYRYKCQMCSKVYPNKDEFETHVSEHSVYIKDDENKYKLHPNLIRSNKLFGYMCSFCYYVQLSYINIEKHMSSRHLEEDKKFNGHWTVIRISMSVGNEDCANSIIDYANLVGCLPPIEDESNISKEFIGNKVSDEQEIKKYSSGLNSTNLSSPDDSKMDEDTSDFEYIEYTLKDNIKKYTVADLSCELIKNSVLLYKCSVSRCALNQFSTVILMDFFKHIELNHQHVIWDKQCNICKYKIENVETEYFLKDALKHIMSHHLVLKKNKESNMSNIVDLDNRDSLSTLSQDIVENTVLETNVQKPMRTLRVRNLPGDILSVSKTNVTEQLTKKLCNELDNNDSISQNDDTINTNTEEEIMINNNEQYNYIFNKSADQNININPVTTDVSFPVLDSPIVDVISLKESDIQKPKALKINHNDGMTMWMKAKTQYEVILPNSNIFLEPGQQIVNNGQPIDGTYYLIDTEYKKYYSKKVRELPLNMMKTRLALTEMLTVPRLLGLFKCMDRTCTKIFTDKDLFKLHMKLHFSNSDKKKKSQMVEQFKMCAYCFKIFDDEDSLANHIAEKYTFCVYFCPNCFYRAYTASHVLVHLSTLHSNIKPSILKLEYGDMNENTKEILMAVDFNEFVLPYVCNTGHCTYSCYVHSDFISHLQQEHQQCDKFCCYICSKNDNGEGFFALQPKLMMKHFKFHNINLFQCIFCLFGTEVIDSMISHLAMEHYEYDSICIERSLMLNCHDTTKIENLKIIKVQKSIDNGLVNVINLPSEINSLPEIQSHKTRKRRLERPDVLSSAMKSAHIDDNQSSDTIVITVPDRAQMENNTPLTQSIDNEFIMLDDVNQSSVQSSLKINNIWSESKVIETNPHLSNDVIIIDDEDDILSNDNTDNSNKRKRLSKHTIEKSEKSKRLALPIIPLNELFVCKDCDLKFSTNDQFYNHLSEDCPFWNSNGRKCMFCPKSFKTIINFFEHTLLHGPDRFKCSYCSFVVPSRRAIGHHMKTAHDITKYKLVPVHDNLSNVNENEFIVNKDGLPQKTSKVNLNFTCSECPYSVSTKKLILLHMKDIHNIEENNTYQINLSPKNKSIQEYQMQRIEPNVLKPQQHTGIKRKRIIHSNNVDSETNSSKAVNIENKIRLLFSPDTIESIPMAHIFSEPIGCLLCTYITKVRSNLILHLNGHKKGEDNTPKEIVNPVPSIGKSELMFDKMINLSASSFEAMNTEKMRIDEINMKIVEMHCLDNLNVEIYPKFIPKNNRYKCSIPLCTFMGITEDMLKKHISILHSDYHCYLCPHCKPESQTRVVELNNIEFHLMHHGENLYKCQYCEYIDFNKDEMKIHMRNVHLFQITTESQSNIIVIRQLMLKDDIIDRHRYQAQKVAAQWICNLCSSGIKYTESEITSHIFMAHNVSNMFKCPMCKFEHNEDNFKVFEDHYKLKHPSVAVKFLKVFERVTDVDELLPKQSNQFINISNMQEQQALESIEPTLMPPTCRGIPVESISISKSYNKSRGVSKSPKKTAKNSPVQVRKQNILIDNFKEDDSLGTISAGGSFSCPKCNVFETTNEYYFREHLYKDINYKTWRCSICSEESDSPKKMAWHVKKHGIGFYNYEKVENVEKFKWVERVIEYQNSLIIKFKNDELNKIMVCDKNTLSSPIKRKQNIESAKKVSSTSKISTTHQSNNIINLLDDSDNE